MASKSDSFQLGYKRLFNALKKENIETWFDMGLLLDRIKDNRKNLAVSANYKKFQKKIVSRVAFLTYSFGVDGVSIEVSKYAHAFEKINRKLNPLKKIKDQIYWIAGHFAKESHSLMQPHWRRVTLEGATGFDDWDGYQEFFHIDLSRGSKEYNQLARKIWQQTIDLSLEIGRLVSENRIELLFPVNVASNPGNVALTFAIVLVSELMDIPVYSSHHDFYWEDGSSKSDRAAGGLPGFRDHFFTNAHLGEVFSLLDVLFPWESSRWFHAPINSFQYFSLINKFGHTPLSVSRIPTSIDLKKYRQCDENERVNILKKLHLIFSEGEKMIITKSVDTASIVPLHGAGMATRFFLGMQMELRLI